MKKNLINIVIPTRNRPDTLLYSLKTVVNQDYDNLRIIVNNNSDVYRNKVRELVKNFRDKRIDYFETDGNLSMTENYENALNKIDEGYIIYLGDDDGLVYNSLRYINKLINETNSLALKSFVSTYRWENLIYEHIKNTLVNYKDDYYTIIDSKKFLEQVCYFMSFSFVKFLPNIYNGGVISIELINKIKNISNNKYFNSPIPDVYSSIINCAETNEYILFFNPLILSGTSKNSTGVSVISKSHKNNKEIQKEFLKLSSKYNSRNLSYTSLNICLADSILDAKKYSKNIPDMNIKALINEVINNELLWHKDDVSMYNSMVEDLEIIADEFNSKDYLYKKLKDINNNKDKIFHKSYYSVPNKYITIKCDKYNLSNINDASLFSNNLISNKNNLKLFPNSKLEYLVKNNYYNDNINILYEINDIYIINNDKYNIFFDYYQKCILNNFYIEALSLYNEVWVTSNYRKNILEKYNKNTKNIFKLKKVYFDRNKETICIAQSIDLELVENIPFNIMSIDYIDTDKENIIDFSLKELDKYHNIIFLDFKIDYFNRILINLENKCYIFPKNKYIENYKYLLNSTEIEDISFLKNINDIYSLE